MGLFMGLWFAALISHFYGYSTRELVRYSLSNALLFYVVSLAWAAWYVCL